MFCISAVILLYPTAEITYFVSNRNFMRTLLPTLIFILCVINVFGQAKMRRLPSIINHPSLNVSSPYISHDGNALLYLANTGQDGELLVMYTSRDRDWSTPVELPKHLQSRLHFLRGFGLSADGKKIYTTSSKSPTVGGYDIFVSELKGTTWSQPENLSLPINTKANEACPSISVDEKSLYFMRCETMSFTRATACQIMVAHKKPNGQWGEPTALPAYINTGNSQAPRIMADNETLIFSSDQMGGSGKMDLFMTRLVNGEWSSPVSIDFLNTEKDDQYVTIAALGRYVITEGQGARKNTELVELLIPEEFRPKGIMKVEGKVLNDLDKPVSSYISVIDLDTKQRFYSGRPNVDGTYTLYLREGARYEISFDAEQSNFTFYSKQLDLRRDNIPQLERWNVTLKPMNVGDELPLDLLEFNTKSELIGTSEAEIKRLARVIKANPTLKFQIEVLQTGYKHDSYRSHPSLTEMASDTVVLRIEDIDDEGQRITLDSVQVTTYFHNDRTVKQAEAIVSQLQAQGVSAAQLTYFVNAKEGEEDKTTIRVRAIKP
jgi:hypothetical protein